jgi:hypothetical protein
VGSLLKTPSLQSQLRNWIRHSKMEFINSQFDEPFYLLNKLIVNFMYCQLNMQFCELAIFSYFYFVNLSFHQLIVPSILCLINWVLH